MAAKEWLVPVVLGLVAAGAAFGLDQMPEPAATTSEPCVVKDYASPYDWFHDVFGGDRNLTTARLTVWVVKLDGGTLLASNGGNDTLGHTYDGDYQTLPSPLIVALGNGTLPPGGIRLPAILASFARPIRENLTGHGLNDVVTLRVDRYPWLDIFGPLQVTARVDALYWPDGNLAGGGPPFEPRTVTLGPGPCPWDS